MTKAKPQIFAGYYRGHALRVELTREALQSAPGADMDAREDFLIEQEKRRLDPILDQRDQRDREIVERKKAQAARRRDPLPVGIKINDSGRYVVKYAGHLLGTFETLAQAVDAKRRFQSKTLGH